MTVEVHYRTAAWVEPTASEVDNGTVSGFDVGDVIEASPTWSVVVLRGLRRRCPRCGGRDVFRNRWRLKERCGTCGYQFRREPGFALGAWFLNFMLLQAIHMVGILGYIVWLSEHRGAGFVVPLAVGVVVTVVVPVLTYPYSQTTWAAIDLIMTPLELTEIVAALESLPADEGDLGGLVPGGE